jgi:hypothetical protein
MGLARLVIFQPVFAVQGTRAKSRRSKRAMNPKRGMATTRQGDKGMTDDRDANRDSTG